MSPELPTGLVQFERVTKRYTLGRRRIYLAAALPFGTGLGRGQSINALDDVSFKIDPGDAVALVGANGAGKSTALKCLAGVAHPTSGRILVGGRVVALIELGIGFHPDLTGLDNARFAMAVAGLRGARAKAAVDEAIAFSEIEDFITTPVKRYSSGMYARLSFGIAVALPADVMIVDEILAVGDIAFQRKCYAYLTELRARAGVTLVFVSHNEWVLKETCRQGVLLVKGRLVEVGPIESILNSYRAHAERVSELGPTDSARLQIREVRVLPDDRRTLGVHEGIEIEVEVDVLGESECPALGVALSDHDGRLVWGIYSDENAIELKIGFQRIRVHIADVAILPGQCRLEVFAFDRTSPVMDDLRRLEFVIEGDVPSRLENGLVHVASAWAVRSV